LKSKDIFFKSGSAARIQELYNVFSSVSWKQAYGKEVTWDTYQVDDAASLLLRYLKLLPEPIIPYNCYKNFTSIYGELISARDTDGECDWTRLDAQTKSRLLETIYLALEETPEVNRHLLLYLLDLLQACVRHSNHNLMTSDRLVAVFQPSLLSLRPDEMSIEEHQIAHQVIVFMIEVLDEGQLREIMSIKGA
jgi:GTPase-activating protein SAC7